MELIEKSASNIAEPSRESLIAEIEQIRSNETFPNVLPILLDENLDGAEFERIWARAFLESKNRKDRTMIVKAGLAFARKFNHWAVFFELNARLIEKGQIFDTIDTRDFAGIVGSISSAYELLYWSFLQGRDYGILDGNFGDAVNGNVERIRRLIQDFGTQGENDVYKAGAVSREHEKVPASNAGKIKVSSTQTQFVLLIGELFRQDKFKSEDGNVPWAEVCKHFSKSDGSEFNPKDLSHEWSEIGKGRIVRGGDEIEEIMKNTSISFNAARESVKNIAGSLSESSISRKGFGKGQLRT